jgi:hypothetical protein
MSRPPVTYLDCARKVDEFASKAISAPAEKARSYALIAQAYAELAKSAAR